MLRFCGLFFILLLFPTTALCVSTLEQWIDSDCHAGKDDDKCQWIDSNRKCPDPEVRFYLYTHSNANYGQLIAVDDTWDNLTASHFDSQHPVKIIIHGFRADMFLTPLFRMKTGKN